MKINSEEKNLNCYRCASAATTYIPEQNRVLCDTHLSTFKEAYASVDFSSVSIDDLNVDAIETMLVKNATDSAVDEVQTADEHRVPIKLIVDHLGELETGVEPATCKVCKKPMQLHSQYAVTKQTVSTVKQGGLTPDQFREVTHPDFLAKFADSGRGICLSCKVNDEFSSGIGRIIQEPSAVKDIYRHLNDDGIVKTSEGQGTEGHYHQLMDYMSAIKGITKEKSIEANLPFIISRYKNLIPNPEFDPSRQSTFPFSIAEYDKMPFGEMAAAQNALRSGEIGRKPITPQQVLHTLFHAAGEQQERVHPGHAHYEPTADASRLGDANRIEVLCTDCGGAGHHPFKDNPDVADEIERAYKKSLEIPRNQQRRIGSVESEGFEMVAHAGPNIKPHDHKNKPAHYQKHDQGAGSAPSSGGSSGGPRTPRAPRSPKAPRMRAPKAPGMGGGFMPRKKPFYLEKFIYDQSNMFHDITHTEYKNPSYMYRNPNPMYYSVPRSGWGDSKPWRN